MFFNFLWSEDGFDAPHGALAARAFQGIGTPDAEDEVAPQGARGPGGGFGWGGVDCYFRFFWRGVFWWGWDEFGGGSGEAAGFVGVKAVVTDYLLAFVPFNGTGNLIIHPPGRTRSAPPWMPMTDSSMSRTTFLSCTPHAGGSCGREITVSG